MSALSDALDATLDKCRLDEKREFEKRYARRLGRTPTQVYEEFGFIAIECDCAQLYCTGWQMVVEENIIDQMAEVGDE